MPNGFMRKHVTDNRPWTGGKLSGITRFDKPVEILDKINQHGFHYLSEEEKEYLRNASKQEL